MTDRNLKHGIGIFSHRQNAEQALTELQSIGFPMQKISMVTKTPEGDEILGCNVIQRPPITRAESAIKGALAGSTGVGLMTLIVGLGILLVPGVGPALAVESMVAVILGSGAATVAGGLHGALRGWFVPEEQARFYSERFNQGDYLAIVEATEDEIQKAEAVLSHWGIQEWHIYNVP
ncbi:MAG: hypothetical protein N4J56_007853 [Chroococcidiopsis sp. SAG 2025]|uniref:hypothetical protein n=1 Tax=unclassified Chroococcidiopsis TaxID=2646205 RepID=UPI000D05C7A5|nr:MULTISPECIES: hypothetical protein [unclassified Chroococcidiopsis]MBE9017628.1 hypothetical protein [Chroococcidiopsidales cyanobacterium LEGE 13417]PSB40699.1 hypothetical protein C7B80_32785 [Cyanosarcina cf. burmensis CCALA 770]MDV2998148.1 hypothetical protein [Chroococcidiopsis sp. SAG 2025]PSM50716.1 hypothetical protein C7Y66_02325 [Chroococcidiopsis sp. CCALA 051]PSM50747.1 hypothetical protein C7Y66_02515 [Chroococcidiopsis sp. CCALA 051]